MTVVEARPSAGSGRCGIEMATHDRLDGHGRDIRTVVSFRDEMPGSLDYFSGRLLPHNRNEHTASVLTPTGKVGDQMKDLGEGRQ
jgi:hypothetical protein